MPPALRNVLFALAILAISALSHARILRAGWLAGDLPHLAAAARVANQADPPASSVERLGWLEGGAVRPIAGLLLTEHAAAFARQGAFSRLHPRTLRALSWALLLAAASCAGLALRRALLPWVGRDQAGAAAFALALLVSAHPLGSATIARPTALGDLAALVLAGLAAALFLRGRQESEKRSVAAALLLVVLAGFASDIALLAAPVLAGLELGSARRARPLATRLRTAATTFVLFAAGASVESLVALVAGAPARAEIAVALPGAPVHADPWLTLAACVEKLGILFLPVPGREGGEAVLWPYYLVSGACVLVALQPVLRSARSAPRLWGWLAIAWLLVLGCALLPHAAVRVEPADFSRAEILFPASIFACAGLAVAATALSGTRRIALPIVIALCFAWLGHAAARGFERAAGEVQGLRADLLRAYSSTGENAQVLVIDPPERAAGLDLGLDALAELVDPVLAASPFRVGVVPRAPRRLDRQALELLARQSEFDAWRRDGLAIVSPQGALASSRELYTQGGASRTREIARLPATEGSTPVPVSWRDKGRSELFDLDPARVRFARIVALPDTSTAEAPKLSWRATEPSNEAFGATGVWLTGASGPIAVFDLSHAIDWWSARTIRRVWTEGALVSVATAELAPDLPLVVREPRVAGDHWELDLAEASAPTPLRCPVAYVLELLDLATLAYARIETTRRPPADGVLVLVASDAARFERARRAAGGGPIAWSLEARCYDTALARASGRR